MFPTLAPGDQILIDLRAYNRQLPREGDLVFVRHPYRTDLQMVKRVVSVDDDGQCDLAGDNPAESTDSRTFGKVPSDYILGRVTSRF